MSLSASETNQNDQSYLTDEVLQEVLEYEQQLEGYKGEEQEEVLLHKHEAENDNDDSFFSNNPLATVESNDGSHLPEDNDSEWHKYYSPSLDDDYPLPTTTNEEGELNQKLCWRLDPSQSLSDWELHIFNRSSKTFEIYYVHRVVMALGPRGCEFFQDVFRQAETGSSQTSASLNKMTRVPLIAESCNMVGCFLDYVYGNEQFEITNENALGMCYLADYFRNHSLWELATDFIEEDLGTQSGREHLHQYYTDSIYYDQDEFLDHILGVCSLNLLWMMEDGIPCTKLLGELTPSHFLKVLVDMEQPTGEKLSSSINLTRLITEFCCMHRNELNVKTFDNLTSRILLLDSSSAVTLLEASLEYDWKNDGDQNHASDDTVSSLISFQQQCIETLSEEWEELLELDQSRVTRIMRILSTRQEHVGILVDWFQKTLKCASIHMMASRQETQKAEQQNLVMEDRFAEMAEKLEVAHEETATSERNHNTTKSEMKTQISFWMRKNEETNKQCQVEQQQWEHERLKWQMVVQQLKHENSNLKNFRHRPFVRTPIYEDHDDNTTKSSIDRDNGRFRQTQTIPQDRPYVIPDDYVDSSEDSESYVTESSSERNSLVENPQSYSRRDTHAYPVENGTSPRFRIF